MFRVKNKVDKKEYTVYGIRCIGGITLFLIYHPVCRSWEWEKANNYIPYVEENEGIHGDLSIYTHISKVGED
jgi:hypothetical protein